MSNQITFTVPQLGMVRAKAPKTKDGLVVVVEVNVAIDNTAKPMVEPYKGSPQLRYYHRKKAERERAGLFDPRKDQQYPQCGGNRVTFSERFYNNRYAQRYKVSGGYRRLLG